ncbi:MAG: 2-hydroxyacyl-CoA dehydratase [Endomicrobium sp.]|jgi:predicted nucleotide-binding protein (sugar kinase/HSP70/actin superfamily)|nr:2-hydroxyacyl-CoA dehydratase [Endomicrobium sp.]
MSPIHFSLAESVFSKYGVKLKVLSKVSANDIEEGLKYVNNDMCYPAIIIIGQFINALKSGKYDLDNTALVISQTGGGCRATNYSRLVRKAISKAGFEKVSVFPLNASKSSQNKSIGFSFPMFRDFILVILYGGLIMKLSNRRRPYERCVGQTDALTESWLRRLSDIISKNAWFNFRRTVKEIIRDFDNIAVKKIKKPRVGIVGAVLVKFHPTANNNLVSSLEKEGADVVVPNLMDTIIYFVLDDVYKHKYLEGSFKSKIISLMTSGYIEMLRAVIRKALNKSDNFGSYQTTKKWQKSF